MKNLFKEFQPSSKEDWLDQIKKELKGKSLEENLHYSDEIQDLNYKAYYHNSDVNLANEVPGSSPYKRGSILNNNNWSINCLVIGKDAKTQNNFALTELNRGADSLTYHLKNFNPNELAVLLNEVGLEFIKTSFFCTTIAQIDAVIALKNNNTSADIKLFGENKVTADYLKQNAANIQNHCLAIDAYQIHAAGGNITQEIAYALHTGHTELYHLLESGVAIDNATCKLKFTFGIDANFLMESVKGRVFRSLWSHIVGQYKPEHECAKNAYIEMKTGFVNKSVKDPYTNILRQTTEAMSAVISGCDELTIQPYDLLATKQDLDFTQRMSNNISLLLKEESYFHNVIDTAGGSYAFESLTNELSKKSYSLFQELEESENSMALLKHKIEKTRGLRKIQFENNTKMLIGVNKYLNPDMIENDWNSKEAILFGEFIIERDCKNIEA